MEAGSDSEKISNGIGKMGKIILIVVIVFSDKPIATYKATMGTAAECHRQEAILSENPPIDDDVVKYMIGCSFEEQLPTAPV